MTAFVEQRLDLGFDYGAQGGRAFLTTTVNLQNGVRRRNQQWADPLGLWSVGSRVVDQAYLDYLIGFLNARRGALVGFRFKDHQDYRANREPLVLDGGGTGQLIKTYAPGASAYVRRITKPVAGTVALYDYDADPAGQLMTAGSDYALGLTTGEIDWLGSPGPAPEADIRWSGEFDVPVTFDRDQVDGQFLAFEERGSEGVQAVFSISPLFVRELRL